MMSHASQVTGLGLVLLCGALVVPGCDSGGDNGDDGKGASSNGGSNAGNNNGGNSNAGKTNGGATNAGSGGASGGSGGSTGQVAMVCPGVVPDAALITDFDMAPAAGAMYEWGSAEQGTMDFWGGTFNYPVGLEVTVADGVMTAAGSITEYAGFGLYVQNCANASSFDGIRFKISGNPPAGEKMKFAVQTNKNEWATGIKGSCMAADAKKFIDCVHPSVAIDVTETPTTVEVTWAELGMGKPAADATTDGSDVIGLQWILPWAVGHAAYDANISIDDVELIGEGGGTGGAGAGGGGNEPMAGAAGGQ